jgi:hypothetical protein
MPFPFGLLPVDMHMFCKLPKKQPDLNGMYDHRDKIK